MQYTSFGLNVSTTQASHAEELTSIDDPDRVGYGFRHIGLHPCPQLLMDLLGLRGRARYNVCEWVRENGELQVWFNCSIGPVPAVERRSCRFQWPTRAHRRVPPCSSPWHYLEKGQLQITRDIFVWYFQTFGKRNLPNNIMYAYCSNATR